MVVVVVGANALLFGPSHLDSAFARVPCVDSNVIFVVVANQGQGGSEVGGLEELGETIGDVKKRRRLCCDLLHHEVFEVLAAAAGCSPVLTAAATGGGRIAVVGALVVVARSAGVTGPRAILLLSVEEFHKGLDNWAVPSAAAVVSEGSGERMEWRAKRAVGVGRGGLVVEAQVTIVQVSLVKVTEVSITSSPLPSPTKVTVKKLFHVIWSLGEVR